MEVPIWKSLFPVATYQNGYVNNFRDYAFCRVAIELENIPNYYLFTEVKKIEGLPVKQWVGSSQRVEILCCFGIYVFN